jgi:hypothetical protein
MPDRSTIDIPCPGALENAVVIAVFPATVYGVGNPANIGSYPLSIGALDRSGTLLNPSHPLELMPGESATWYYPPANAYKIIAVGWRNYYGTTTLEYDTPNA